MYVGWTNDVEAWMFMVFSGFVVWIGVFVMLIGLVVFG